MSLSSYLPSSSSKLTGSFYSQPVDQEPQCYFSNDGEVSQIPVGSCCPSAREMARCVSSSSGVTCFNSEDRNLTLNHEAVEYCSSRGIELG
ncbi:hypothetical protein GKQ38_03685 [Candidatus Nanohaloarchaea archaeon]|nr:hypothetical protein GKQ38_03685 [Candidatus Nanohaloarchaea archaeon]